MHTPRKDMKMFKILALLHIVGDCSVLTIYIKQKERLSL